MATDFAAIVGNHCHCDDLVFSDWLAGRPVTDAVARRIALLQRLLVHAHAAPPPIVPPAPMAATALLEATADAPEEEGNPAAPPSPPPADVNPRSPHLAPSAAAAIAAGIDKDDAFGPVRASPVPMSAATLDGSNSEVLPSSSAINTAVLPPMRPLGARRGLSGSLSRVSLQMQRVFSRSKLPGSESGTPIGGPSSRSASFSSLPNAADQVPSVTPRGSFSGSMATSTVGRGGGGGALSRRASLLGDIRRAVGSVLDSMTGGNNSNPASPAMRGMHSSAANAAAAAAAAATLPPGALIPPALVRAARAHVVEQYRQFALAESFLHRPAHFLTQAVVPYPRRARRRMVQAYYAVDERVMREVLGKKLNSKTRRELDEWVAANGPAGRKLVEVGVLAARRMLDNVKRVMKRTEDVVEGDAVISLLGGEFAMRRGLARRYAAIHFYAIHRIDTTSKRKLAHYTFADLEHCAMAFLDHWTRAAGESTPLVLTDTQSAAMRARATNQYASIDSVANGSGGITAADTLATPTSAATTTTATAVAADLDDDPLGTLAADLCDVKAVIMSGARDRDAAERARSVLAAAAAAAAQVPGLPADPSATVDAATAIPSAAALRGLLRSLVALGSGLSTTSARRAVLADVVDKIVDPAVAASWSVAETDRVLAAIAASVAEGLATGYLAPGVNVGGSGGSGGAAAADRATVAAAAWSRWTLGMRVAVMRLLARRIGEVDAVEEEVEV
ncbi:acidic fibroblast growth factor binding-domain-containing protein [Blastocladiella britannica]|nr:acidic fibroblast growth factor binding-domain-containing protein [Blastocladiella britannica]